MNSVDFFRNRSSWSTGEGWLATPDALQKDIVYIPGIPETGGREITKATNQVPLDMDKISELYSSLILVPKVDGKVRLYLDLARLNKAVIRSVHRGLTLNDILPRLADVKYFMLIDASSGYHDLKLDERASKLTSSCALGRYRYIRLPFRAAQAGGMFQKIDEIFSSMPNEFSIADDNFIAGFYEQGKDHSDTLEKVLWICRQANLKLNKDKCLFRCTSIPFFCEVISREGVRLEPKKVQALTDMPPPKSKLELQSFLGKLNYLNKFSSVTAEVCKPLHQ